MSTPRLFTYNITASTCEISAKMLSTSLLQPEVLIYTLQAESPILLLVLTSTIMVGQSNEVLVLALPIGTAATHVPSPISILCIDMTALGVPLL